VNLDGLCRTRFQNSMENSFDNSRIDEGALL